MTKATLTALGAALIALGQELQATETPTIPGEEKLDPTPTPRRGRGKAEPPAEPKAEEKPAAAAGKPESELRELIRPLVEDQGRGAEVKAILTRLGATSLSTLTPEKHGEFTRCIEALLI